VKKLGEGWTKSEGAEPPPRPRPRTATDYASTIHVPIWPDGGGHKNVSEMDWTYPRPDV